MRYIYIYIYIYISVPYCGNGGVENFGLVIQTAGPSGRAV